MDNINQSVKPQAPAENFSSAIRHSPLPLPQRLARVIREEIGSLHVRLTLIQWLLAPVPFAAGARLRSYGLRLSGFRVGRGAIMHGLPLIVGIGDVRRRLEIGQDCFFNVGCVLEVEDQIVIGDRVRLAQEVMILTSTHEIGSRLCRAAVHITRPVRIGAGSWLGARCTILPGVTVGEGAVVAAGAVVHRDVPPDTLVGGVPAQVIQTLP